MLIYFVSPIDIIPDSIPAIGYFDDAAVVAACWKLVESDIEEYEKWRVENINKIYCVHRKICRKSLRNSFPLLRFGV